MVGDYCIHRSVCNGIPKRFDILSRPQRRIHLVRRGISADKHIGLVERKVVRSHITCNGKSLFLRLPYGIHGQLCAHMGKMDRAVRLTAEGYAAVDVYYLGGSGPSFHAARGGDSTLVHLGLYRQGRLLRVLHYSHAKVPRIKKGCLQQFCVRHRGTVISEKNCPGFGHQGKFCKLFPLAPPAHAPRRKDSRRPGSLPPGYQVFHGYRIIHHGIGIGHCHDRGKPAPRSCPCSALRILVPFVAGIPKMNVKINESGAYQLSSEIEDLGSIPGKVFTPACDHPVLQEKIFGCRTNASAVENTGIFEQYHLSYTSKAKVKQGHSDRDTASDLFQDDAPGTVRHGRCDLHSAVHGSGMHHHSPG